MEKQSLWSVVMGLASHLPRAVMVGFMCQLVQAAVSVIQSNTDLGVAWKVSWRCD